MGREVRPGVWGGGRVVGNQQLQGTQAQGTGFTVIQDSKSAAGLSL